MPTLYRTPNVMIDRHEWHAIVLLRAGRVSLSYRWRPLATRVERWQDVTSWQGPKPKGLAGEFWRFRTHIREAMDSERSRRDALAGCFVRTNSMDRTPGRRTRLGLVA